MIFMENVEGEKNHSIYIIVYALNDPIDGIIRKYTKDYYNHAALGFDLDLTEVYTFSMVSNSISKRPFADRPPFTDFLLYELKVTAEEYATVRKNVDAILNDPEYTYNFKALLRKMFNMEIKTYDKQFYCSEFVYTILKTSNLYNIKKKNGLALASSFTRLKNKKIYNLIAKGTVGELRKSGIRSLLIRGVK